MIRNRLLAVILCIGVIASCQKDKEDEIESFDSTLINISFEGSGSTAESRISYTPNGETSQFKWSVNDKASLIVPEIDGNENQEFVTTTASQSSNFGGSVKTWTGMKSVYSIFPYKSTPYVISGADEPSTATVNLSVVGQEIKLGVTNKYDNSYMLAMANNATAINAKSYDIPKLVFNQVMSILKFNVTSVQDGVSIMEIGIRTDTEKLLSNADILISTATVTGTPIKVKKISATVTGVTTGSDIEVALSLFPVDLTGEDITIYMKTYNVIGEIQEYEIHITGMNYLRNVIYSVDFSLVPSNIAPKKFSPTASGHGQTFILDLGREITISDLTWDVAGVTVSNFWGTEYRFVVPSNISKDITVGSWKKIKVNNNSIDVVSSSKSDPDAIPTSFGETSERKFIGTIAGVLRIDITQEAGPMFEYLGRYGSPLTDVEKNLPENEGHIRRRAIITSGANQDIKWGPKGKQTNINDNWHGLLNTRALVDLGSEYAAANYCATMGEGWYLPAQNQLAGAWVAHSGLTAIYNQNYWSSTETGSDHSWYVKFSNGDEGGEADYFYKTGYPFRVLCIRDL